MEKLECDKRTDPMDRMIRDMTAEEVVGWLVEYKGLPESSRGNVVSNLAEQLRWHRLRGRLDRSPVLAALFELWLMARHQRAETAPLDIQIHGLP